LPMLTETTPNTEINDIYVSGRIVRGFMKQSTPSTITRNRA
jgi:hypothetical protein